MSIYIHKSHNFSVLLYHIVCPVRYRKMIFSEEVGQVLKEICIQISKRYEIHFIEVGTDGDHVHFLVQSVPTYSPTKIVRTIKIITVRELFRRLSSAKEILWGGELWTDGYYVNTVGKTGNETVIQKYIQDQGNEGEYKQLHYEQLKLF